MKSQKKPLILLCAKSRSFQPYLFQDFRSNERLYQGQHFINEANSVNDVYFLQLCWETLLHVKEELPDALYTNSGQVTHCHRIGAKRNNISYRERVQGEHLKEGTYMSHFSCQTKR